MSTSNYTHCCKFDSDEDKHIVVVYQLEKQNISEEHNKKIQ